MSFMFIHPLMKVLDYIYLTYHALIRVVNMNVQQEWVKEEN